MNDDQLNQLKNLKQKFRTFSSQERQQLGVSLLKMKLGVHQPQEAQQVFDFLGQFHMRVTVDNLDLLMNYLHSEDHSLPEFLAMEDSLHFSQSDMALPSYQEDEVETLKEPLPPFKTMS